MSRTHIFLPWAIVDAQTLLKQDFSRISRKLFLASEAELIRELVRCDLPYNDATISESFVNDMNQLARDLGILNGTPGYEDVVARQFSKRWSMVQPHPGEARP